MTISKIISTFAAAAALAGSFIVASPASADSLRCNDRGCRYNTSASHRYHGPASSARHAADAAADAATAAAWAHYVHEQILDEDD